MRILDASEGARLVSAAPRTDPASEPWVLECLLRGEWRELSRFPDEGAGVQAAIDMGMPPEDLGKLLRVRFTGGEGDS